VLGLVVVPGAVGEREEFWLRVHRLWGLSTASCVFALSSVTACVLNLQLGRTYIHLERRGCSFGCKRDTLIRRGF